MEVTRPSPGARKGKHPGGGRARIILALSRAPEKANQNLPENLYLKAGTLGETSQSDPESVSESRRFRGKNKTLIRLKQILRTRTSP